MLTWHSLCIYTVHYRDCTGPLKRSAALQCYPMPSVSWAMETIPGERTKQKHWKTEQKTCTSEATSQRSKENRETHLIRQQHAFIYSVKNSVEKQQFIKREWVVSNAHLRLRDGGKKEVYSSDIDSCVDCCMFQNMYCAVYDTLMASATPALS